MGEKILAFKRKLNIFHRGRKNTRFQKKVEHFSTWAKKYSLSKESWTFFNVGEKILAFKRKLNIFQRGRKNTRFQKKVEHFSTWAKKYSLSKESWTFFNFFNCPRSKKLQIENGRLATSIPRFKMSSFNFSSVLYIWYKGYTEHNERNIKFQVQIEKKRRFLLTQKVKLNFENQF